MTAFGVDKNNRTRLVLRCDRIGAIDNRKIFLSNFETIVNNKKETKSYRIKILYRFSLTKQIGNTRVKLVVYISLILHMNKFMQPTSQMKRWLPTFSVKQTLKM